MSKSKLPWTCIVVLLMLASIGLAQEREQSPDAARARAEKAMRDTLKVMRDADKLTDKQVDERFDKDLKQVHDVGVAEIERQGRHEQRGQAEDRARVRQRDDDPMRGVRLRLRSKTEALLPPLGEHIGRHCGLDQAAADTFRAVVFESVNTMLDQDGTRSRALEYLLADDFTLVETMLSQPGWRGAFAKCLTEKQLQDYTEFTHTRRQLDQQAVRRQVVAWLDQPLSLTADQRAQVEQAILAATEESDAKISSLALTGTNLRRDLMDSFSGLIAQLPDNRLDDILTPAQAKVWALMSPQSNRARRDHREQQGRDDNRRDENPRLARYRAAEAELNGAVEAGRITREQANERLIGLRQRLWADGVAVRQDDDAPESEDQVRRLAEAQLAAHTEQLGKLDDRAAKRLKLAAKGAVEQVLESQDTGQRGNTNNRGDADLERRAIAIRDAVVAGRLTREQAAEVLSAMRQRGSEARQQKAILDITSHPLYQQTIKDVLSAEAYAKYQAQQAESLAFRQQAARDLVVASLDLQLWLGEKQRKRFELAAAKLPAQQANAIVPAPAEMVTELYEHFSSTNRTVLSPWQTQEFQDISTGRNRRER